MRTKILKPRGSKKTDLLKRLRLYRSVWGLLPSIAPHSLEAPGYSTGMVITDIGDAIEEINRQAAVIRDLRRKLKEHLAPGNVAVRQLKWFVDRWGDTSARSLMGEYSCRDIGKGKWVVFLAEQHLFPVVDGVPMRFPVLSAACSAAQHDYATKIQAEIDSR